ncbi:cytosine permease [Mycobacterium sp. NAZ190054]|uniref:cytosine permease n=1 Tax=Mycobacterium sp. NAZ190054 TaxID=1747766 RepID=UPI00079AEB68|nr:cytosine permease [Mycobacterium sp. NAZ190054]KWX69080.1 hypothetical protein ASJ79_15115 [Mycobacterium sp. NAZ190054]
MRALKGGGAGLDNAPMLRSERTWTGGTLLASSTSTAVATWCFVLGGTVSYYLGAAAGTVIMMAGILIGIGAILVSIVPVSTKYGLDSALASKPFLGSRGWFFTVGLLFLTLAGWNTVIVVILGRAVTEILLALGLVTEAARTPTSIIAMLSGLVVVWLVIRRGSSALAASSKWIAIGVCVLAAAVLALVLQKVGLQGLLDTAPQAPFEDRATNIAISLEAFIATAVAWWPYVGGMVRSVPSARKALWPSVFGLAVPLAAVSVIGLYAGLAIPESGGDPTMFLTDVGGLLFGVIALAFIVLANIGSTMVGAYAAAVGVRQVPAVAARTSWSAVCAATLVPTALVVIFFADGFVDNLPIFLAGCSLFFAPMCGIQAVDFLILRRQRLDIRSLYTDGAANLYRFWGGFNPAAVIGFAAGIATFVALLNPVTYEPKGIFSYTTASVPSMFVAGAVYWVASLVVRRLGKGGYGAALQSTPETPVR